MRVKLRDQVHPSVRVLISGCLPPPIGGMATFYENLLGSSLSARVQLTFVQTSTHRRELSASGRLSFLNLISAAGDCWRFLLAVVRNRPQIAHIGVAFGLSFVKNSVCILLARLLGCRVLLHPHCGLAGLYSDRSPAWRWYFRQVLRFVHGVIVLSGEWNQLSSIVPACPIYGLPNAVNLRSFQGVVARRRAKPREQGPLQVLYLGYLGRAKGTFDLLEVAKRAAAAHDDLRFLLVGGELTPGELGELKSAAVGLETFLEIRPPVYGDEKLRLFSQADIFVFPSYSEGMPMAVLEAMASGLPVVATAIGGLPDLIHNHVNGLLVPPGSPDQLLVALRALAGDRDLRETMGASSLKLMAEGYDIERRVDQLLAIYTLLLTDKRVRSENAGIDLST